jgi:hypothetical protein
LSISARPRFTRGVDSFFEGFMLTILTRQIGGFPTS